MLRQSATRIQLVNIVYYNLKVPHLRADPPYECSEVVLQSATVMEVLLWRAFQPESVVERRHS